MDLFCPHCTRRVSVPDDKAGQVMSCPLCAKQFQAPSLAPPPSSPKPPAPPPSAATPESTISEGEPPHRPAPSAPGAPGAPPDAALPPGDYTRSFAVSLKAVWLRFVPLACMFLIFILSFFTWHHDVDHTASLWGMSFWPQGGDVKQAHFLAYTILMLFPTGLLVIAAFAINVVPLPPQVGMLKGWLDLAAAFFLGVTFLMFCIDYADAHFTARYNAIMLAMKIAFRLHLIAVLASFGMFWLYLRSRRNLPPPKLEARW